MKNNILCSVIGTFGAGIAYLFGGWDSSLITLLIFMGIDFTTGLLLSGVFKKSTKTQSGALESKTCWQGLCRKGMTLLFVLIAVRLDIAIGTSYIRDAVCITFILNELLSVIENAGLMGIPIPEVIINAIEILKRKENKESEGK